MNTSQRKAFPRSRGWTSAAIFVKYSLNKRAGDCFHFKTSCFLVSPCPSLAWAFHICSLSTQSASPEFVFCLKSSQFSLSCHFSKQKKIPSALLPGLPAPFPSRRIFLLFSASDNGGAGLLLMSYTRFLCASRNLWDAVLRFMQTLLSRIVVGISIIWVRVCSHLCHQLTICTKSIFLQISLLTCVFFFCSFPCN